MIRHEALRPLGGFAFSQQMGQHRTADAATTQQAASDDEAQQPALSALALVVEVFVFVPLLVLAHEAITIRADEFEQKQCSPSKTPFTKSVPSQRISLSGRTERMIGLNRITDLPGGAT